MQTPYKDIPKLKKSKSKSQENFQFNDWIKAVTKVIENSSNNKEMLVVDTQQNKSKQKDLCTYSSKIFKGKTMYSCIADSKSTDRKKDSRDASIVIGKPCLANKSARSSNSIDKRSDKNLHLFRRKLRYYEKN